MVITHQGTHTSRSKMVRLKKIVKKKKVSKKNDPPPSVNAYSVRMQGFFPHPVMPLL